MISEPKLKIEPGMEFTYNGTPGYKVVSYVQDEPLVTCESPHVNTNGSRPQFKIGVLVFKALMEGKELPVSEPKPVRTVTILKTKLDDSKFLAELEKTVEKPKSGIEEALAKGEV